MLLRVRPWTASRRNTRNIVRMAARSGGLPGAACAVLSAMHVKLPGDACSVRTRLADSPVSGVQKDMPAEEEDP